MIHVTTRDAFFVSFAAFLSGINSPSVTAQFGSGKDLVILAKDRRIKVLEEENRQLKRQLQIALGKAYDQLS